MLAEQAAGDFEPISEESLLERRRALSKGAEQFATVINRQPDGGAAWRAYLRWEAVEALAEPAAEPNLAALQASLERLNSGAAGLEQPAARSAAHALDRYINAAALAASSNQAGRYGQAVRSVPPLLAEDAAITNEWRGYLLERRLDLLLNLGQADDFVAEARRPYTKPNLLLTINEATLDRLIRRPVSSRSPIHDRILGARVVGTGDTQGWLSADVQPSPDGARLRFSLRGLIRSETTSYKGPIAVRSTGSTPIVATKTVRLTPEAFYLMPASASAQTRSRTRSIRKVGGGLGAGLIEKLAERRVASDRPIADRISSSRASGKVAASFDRRIEDAARQLRRRYDDAWTKPLARYGATPDRFRLSTSETTLDAFLLQANGGQLGASITPPPPAEGDVAARLHTSAVQNLATAMLGGATISKSRPGERAKLSVELPDWIEKLLDRASPDEQPEEESEGTLETGGFKPWQIRLRRVRPLSVRIEEEVITVILHTDQLQSGGDQFQGWDLIVKYSPRLVDGLWVLERQGDVDARRTRPDDRLGWRIRTRDRPVYSNLIKSIQEASSLPESVTLEPLDLTDRDINGVSSLLVKSIELSKNWLAVGLTAE